MKLERENVNNPQSCTTSEMLLPSTGGTVKCRAFVLGPLAGGERWSLATVRPKRTTVVECYDLLLSEGSTDATVPAIF
jgi:hypothetical protein